MQHVLYAIQTMDYLILSQILQHWRGGLSDTVWTFFSCLGNGGAFWITLAVALLFFRRTSRTGITVLLALLYGVLLGNVFLKPLVMRPRPFVTYPDLKALFVPGDRWSFPSGHTLSGFAAATVLAAYHPRMRVPALLLAALIGFSRLYACVHYPTDVLAGLLLGMLCGWLAYWQTSRLAGRFPPHPTEKG